MKSLLLGAALAVSALFNVVAFVRLSEDKAAVEPVRKPRLKVDGEASVEAVPVEPAIPIPDAPPAAISAPAGLALSQASIRKDPKVQEVLEADDAYGSFWKDLSRLAKVRGGFDESAYQQSVLAATVEFLQLSDWSRASFEEAAKAAANTTVLAAREHEEARAALPPRDRSNPSALAAYEVQRNAPDFRYRNQVQAAVDGLKPFLNPADPRHIRFLSNADRWLRLLAPRTLK